ncbi:hypothetical protein ABVF61_26810 [Roseibium sp. HPY-6]|uniref:hypothetical protein n=1 Tax=Roseibium sp. HPY-6 TaxID=3229852 RepID=UPI00338D55AF
MNSFFLVAAALSAGTCLIHTFLGGREIAVPLLNATGLGPVPKYVSYYCWHIATIALAAMAIMFAVAAAYPQSWELGWTATGLAVSFCLLGVALPPLKKQSYKAMPQGWLFLPIACFGIAGGV